MNAQLVGSVYFTDGRLVLKPLPGYEHVFPPGSESILERPPTPSLSPLPDEIRPEPEDATTPPGDSRANTRKRTYPGIEAEKPYSKRPQYDQVSLIEFRVGDLQRLREFYITRLTEVGIIALRRVVTEWIRILEPTRLRDYGPYHKLEKYRLDPELLTTNSQSRQRLPPWWPRHIPYVEPAHLPSKGLETLGAELMLLQISTDKQYYRYHVGEDLIAKLYDCAKYVVTCVPVRKYAASGDERNAILKERALKVILPDILRATRAFKEHYAQEGNDEVISEKTLAYEVLRPPARKKYGKRVKTVMAVDNILNAPSDSVP